MQRFIMKVVCELCNMADDEWGEDISPRLLRKVERPKSPKRVGRGSREAGMGKAPGRRRRGGPRQMHTVARLQHRRRGLGETEHRESELVSSLKQKNVR